jgi:hypothetical protein
MVFATGTDNVRYDGRIGEKDELRWLNNRYIESGLGSMV